MVGLKVTLFLFLFHTYIAKLSVNMLAAYLCLTFCDLMNCSPPDSSVHGTLQAGILEWTGVYFHSVLQGIFQTQGSNPGLLQCRWILYQLSHKGAQEYWSG